MAHRSGDKRAEWPNGPLFACLRAVAGYQTQQAFSLKLEADGVPGADGLLERIEASGTPVQRSSLLLVARRLVGTINSRVNPLRRLDVNPDGQLTNIGSFLDSADAEQTGRALGGFGDPADLWLEETRVLSAARMRGHLRIAVPLDFQFAGLPTTDVQSIILSLQELLSQRDIEVKHLFDRSTDGALKGCQGESRRDVDVVIGAPAQLLGSEPFSMLELVPGSQFLSLEYGVVGFSESSILSNMPASLNGARLAVWNAGTEAAWAEAQLAESLNVRLGLWLFSQDDILDGVEFVHIIRTSQDPSIRFIYHRLSEILPSHIQEVGDGISAGEDVVKAYIQGLNTIIEGPPIWTDPAMASIELHRKPRKLRDRNPRHFEGIAELHRRLLEQVLGGAQQFTRTRKCPAKSIRSRDDAVQKVLGDSARSTVAMVPANWWTAESKNYQRLKYLPIGHLQYGLATRRRGEYDELADICAEAVSLD